MVYHVQDGNPEKLVYNSVWVWVWEQGNLWCKSHSEEKKYPGIIRDGKKGKERFFLPLPFILSVSLWILWQPPTLGRVVSLHPLIPVLIHPEPPSQTHPEKVFNLGTLWSNQVDTWNSPATLALGELTIYQT
jgi:hypothetical protein